MNRLFESSPKMDIPNTVYAETIFHSAPYILHPNRALRTGMKPTPYKKSYEINTGHNHLLLISEEQTNNFRFSVYL